MDEGNGAGGSSQEGWRQAFDCATWLHKARSMAKDQFKQEAEKELTGGSEPLEIIYFQLLQDPNSGGRAGD